MKSTTASSPSKNPQPVSAASSSSETTQVKGPAQPFAEESTSIRVSIADPQVLIVWNSPVPTNVYHTPLSFAESPQAVGAPVEVEREVKFNDATRFDFFISNKKDQAFVEVKNVTLKRNKDFAEFPDAPTVRGQNIC